jgi:hypothetical protein
MIFRTNGQHVPGRGELASSARRGVLPVNPAARLTGIVQRTISYQRQGDVRKLLGTQLLLADVCHL